MAASYAIVARGWCSLSTAGRISESGGGGAGLTLWSSAGRKASISASENVMSSLYLRTLCAALSGITHIKGAFSMHRLNNHLTGIEFGRLGRRHLHFRPRNPDKLDLAALMTLRRA